MDTSGEVRDGKITQVGKPATTKNYLIEEARYAYICINKSLKVLTKARQTKSGKPTMHIKITIQNNTVNSFLSKRQKAGAGLLSMPCRRTNCRGNLICDPCFLSPSRSPPPSPFLFENMGG